MNADLNVDSLAALNILVVDDVQASARTLAMMLTVLGQKVQTAFDGHTAISLVESEAFDVVFLDIGMPRMDGLKVAKQLRSSPMLKDLFLVALTGYGEDVDRQHSFDAGFNEHLTKPTSINELRNVLQRAILRKASASSMP